MSKGSGVIVLEFLVLSVNSYNMSSTLVTCKLNNCNKLFIKRERHYFKCIQYTFRLDVYSILCYINKNSGNLFFSKNMFIFAYLGLIFIYVTNCYIDLQLTLFTINSLHSSYISCFSCSFCYFFFFFYFFPIISYSLFWFILVLVL